MHCPTEGSFANSSVIYAVIRLLGEDTLDIEYHLPRLVQIAEDALTKKEWQAKLFDWARESLLRLVREKGPAIPEMYRRRALRALMPVPHYVFPPHIQPLAELDAAELLLSLSHDNTLPMADQNISAAGVEWAGINGEGLEVGALWFDGYRL